MAAATELATAYVQIIPSMKGSTGKIKTEITGDMEDAGEKGGKTFGQKFATFAKRIITAAAIGKVIVQSIAEGAKIEQSFGGLETMFKESYSIIAGYAQDAWKTAGISANEYAEQATLFSASLLQSVGGDTQKAAELANMALMDMGDNINKFGGDLSMVQSAYQGLARGSYVMLDNLKLGYKGTAHEMMRLINDSGVLGYTLTDVSQLADVGFGTMVEAIHKVQENLNITGTTAKEASSTISGSLKQMKGAFTNVMAAMSMVGKEGMGILNLDEALQDLMVGVNDFASNIIPAITTVFQTLPVALATMISNMAPILIEQVPVLVKGFADGLIIGVPTLIKAAITLIQGLSGGIRESIPAFINEAMPLLLNFSQELLNNMSLLVEAGIELVIGLVQGLMDGLPTLIEFVPQIISNIANIINQNMPKILEAGIRILLELIKGLIKAIPSLIANAGNIVKAIWDVFLAFKWVDLGKNIINGIKKGIEGFKDRLIESFKNIAKNAFNAVKNFFGIKSPSKLMEKEIGRFIPEGIAVGITANTKSVTRAMDDISSMTLGSAENMIGRSRIPSDFGNGNMSTNNYGGFNFNIYARDNQSAKDIAEEVQSLIMNEINAGRKVFA